jgi:hypothetical protein
MRLSLTLSRSLRCSGHFFCNAKTEGRGDGDSHLATKVHIEASDSLGRIAQGASYVYFGPTQFAEHRYDTGEPQASSMR